MYTCQLSSINLRNLKETACQITYKTLYDDLREKEVAHKKGNYIMSDKIRKEYEETIQQWLTACVPKDAVLDRIERNQASVEVNWL